MIIVGGSPTDNIQYQLIKQQFQCMAQYLSWNVLFLQSYFANSRDDLSNNKQALSELEKLGQQLD